MNDKRVAWDPGPPSENDKPNMYSIWLKPLENLSLEALKYLRDSFEIETESLIKLKKRYCDQQYHLLAQGLSPIRLDELEDTMKKMDIPYEIRVEKENV